MKRLQALLLIACMLILNRLAFASQAKPIHHSTSAKAIHVRPKAPLAAIGVGSRDREAPLTHSVSAEIEALASQNFADGVEYSILVEDLESGRVVYSKDADALLNPASNTKILTTLAALSLLGPDYTFKTQLLGSPGAAKGHLSSLALKGFGDPLFSSERLEAMVAQLKAQGVRQVDQILVDGSYFDGEEFPGQMEGRQRDAAFNCNVGAISLDHNLLELVVTPGDKVGSKAEVEVQPPLDSLPMTGEVTTQRKKGRVIVKNAGKTAEDLTLEVNGAIAAKAEPQTYKVSVHHPLLLAGLRLVEALKKSGIEVPTEAKLGTAGAKSQVLAESSSPPLSEILQEINKHSDNFMAEELTKALGAKFAGAPGNTSKGVAVILKRLREMGIHTEGIEMENGSGLSKRNRLRAATLAQALQKAYLDPKLRQDFVSSLSVLGVDGTLRRKFRHTDLAGRFLGKTGTLDGVSALSGYVFPKNAESDHPYVYSFIVNGRGKDFWKEKQLAQDILEILLNQ